jgi:hypothetical protein
MESVLTKPNFAETKVTDLVSAPAPRRSSKAFNSFQIAQTQFDKVAEYLGLDPVLPQSMCPRRSKTSRALERRAARLSKTQCRK